MLLAFSHLYAIFFLAWLLSCPQGFCDNYQFDYVNRSSQNITLATGCVGGEAYNNMSYIETEDLLSIYDPVSWGWMELNGKGGGAKWGEPHTVSWSREVNCSAPSVLLCRDELKLLKL